jgi:hypothetical protein
MPTDLNPVPACKRAQRADAQTETTMILFLLIICLGMFGLLLEVIRLYP